MEPKDFLELELNKLLEKFNGIEIKYENDPQEDLHIVEILPVELFEDNRLYIDSEMELKEKFYSAFPLHSLMFVSEDSLTRVENPEFILRAPSFSYSIKGKEELHTISEIENFRNHFFRFDADGIIFKSTFNNNLLIDSCSFNEILFDDDLESNRALAA